MSLNQLNGIGSLFRACSRVVWLADVAAVAGMAAYTWLSLGYAHTRNSILDEGAYLLKGYYFITGQYRIYQDFGFWSNHMPLAFYIPGWVQLLFGPGLRSGRYFAVLVSVLMLLGLWLLVRRLAGKWWALAAVLVLLFSPAVTKMYSVYVTQGLIACLLVWMLLLALGNGRSGWQIMLSAILAGIIILIRINMAPLAPLFVLYVFWQHGKKLGLAAMAVNVLVLGLGHALFWPGILRMWAYWLPEPLAPFLAAWRPPAETLLAWDPDIDLTGRLASLFSAFRINFLALTTPFGAWLFWPAKESWRSRSAYKSAIFLSALLVSLFLLHAWATLGKNYCVYCLAGYTTFFSATGLLLCVLTFQSWSRAGSTWKQIGVVLLVLVMATGIGLAAFETYGAQLFKAQIPLLLGRFIPDPGSDQFGPWLRNAYGLDNSSIRQLLSALTGFGVGLVVLLSGLAAYLVAAFGLRRPAGLAYWVLVIFFVLGAILTPSQVLAGGYEVYECSGDVIQAYESVGKYLSEAIPPGSSVYWKGGLSAVPLLYLPGIKIYPAQVNADYSFREGGDPNSLARYGFWNKEMALQWLNEADFVLVQARYFGDWLADAISQGQFVELDSSPPVVNCMDNAEIRIFRRVP